MECIKAICKGSQNGTDIYYATPAGNTMLQYCSYLKDYLYIQDCIKDCRIKDYWPDEDEIEEFMEDNCDFDYVAYMKNKTGIYFDKYLRRF